MTGWNDVPPPETPRLGPVGIALGLVRLTFMAAVIYGLMLLLILFRLLETPFGRHPVSPFVVQLACKLTMRILGMPLKVTGRPMRHRGAIVANHCSWLDIFPLNAAARIYFVAKDEVSGWPAIGLVARATGTIFIERRATEARRQKEQFEQRLLSGERLLFFPEGTSTDSLRVITFKSTLFAAFFAPHLRHTMWIQPASLVYTPPKGEAARFYGWWGDMDFLPNFLKMLTATRTGRVEIIFHAPVRVDDFADRKALARHCEQTVRAGLQARKGPAP